MESNDSLYWWGFRKCANDEWFLASERTAYVPPKQTKKVSKTKSVLRFVLTILGVSAAFAIGLYAVALIVECLAMKLDGVFDAIIATL